MDSYTDELSSSSGDKTTTQQGLQNTIKYLKDRKFSEKGRPKGAPLMLDEYFLKHIAPKYGVCTPTAASSQAKDQDGNKANENNDPIMEDYRKCYNQLGKVNLKEYMRKGKQMKALQMASSQPKLKPMPLENPANTQGDTEEGSDTASPVIPGTDVNKTPDLSASGAVRRRSLQ